MRMKPMKNLLTTLTFLALFFPMAAFCTVDVRCFQDQYGDLYKFSGGKLGGKAYMVKVHTGCATPQVGVAAFSKLADGSYLLSGYVGGDITGVCAPFQFDAAIDANVSVGTGSYDNFPRNDTPDGSINLTPISCTLVSAPVSAGKTMIGNSPGKPTE